MSDAGADRRSRRCSPPWRVAGCGEKRSVSGRRTERFDLALDFYPNPDHAGIYAALDAATSRDAGLDVQPQVPSDPSAPIKQVAAGQVDLAISYEPEVLLARDQGLDVVAVARARQRPADLADLAAGVRDPARRPTCAARRSAPPGSPTRPPT